MNVIQYKTMKRILLALLLAVTFTACCGKDIEERVWCPHKQLSAGEKRAECLDECDNACDNSSQPIYCQTCIENCKTIE